MLHDSATIQANHERFVSRVAESEVIWGLQAPTGFAVCPSNDDEEQQVLMFWSDRGYASRVKQNHFQEYEPVEISLFDFLFRWLRGMEGDGALAGTNWNGDLAGREIAPSEVARSTARRNGQGPCAAVLGPTSRRAQAARQIALRSGQPYNQPLGITKRDRSN